MFTRHGHHIDGSTFIDCERSVARCGGPTLCHDCKTDTMEWQTKYGKEQSVAEAPASLNVKINVAPERLKLLNEAVTEYRTKSREMHEALVKVQVAMEGMRDAFVVTSEAN